MHFKQRILAACQLSFESEREHRLANFALKTRPHKHLHFGVFLFLHFGFDPLTQASKVHELDPAAAETALDERIDFIMRSVPAKAAVGLLCVVTD